MTIDPALILSADSARDSAVLLSAATQFVLATALGKIYEREKWDELSDTDWDILDSRIAQAAFEIEDVQEGSGAVEKLAARVGRATDQALPAGGAEIGFDDPAGTSDGFDYGGFWGASEPGRLTVPPSKGGVYLVSANVDISGTVNAVRGGFVLLNGVTTGEAFENDVAAGQRVFNMSVILAMVPGDYVQLKAYSSVSGNHANASDSSPYLSLARLFE